MYQVYFNSMTPRNHKNSQAWHHQRKPVPAYAKKGIPNQTRTCLLSIQYVNTQAASKHPTCRQWPANHSA